jgi:phage regulator Rha-like protein
VAFLIQNTMLTIGKETMTSREIAETSGKQHKHVLEAIRAMEPAWMKVNGSNFRLVKYTDAKGEKRPEYQLTKTECLYIATKFNDEARAKLVLRWQELEIQSTPKTFAQALRLAAEQAEALELKEAQIQGLEQALDTSEQWISIVRAAKQSGVKETMFNWRALKEYSLYNGIEIKEAPCPRYGTKKLYHVSVFKNLYSFFKHDSGIIEKF